MESKGDEPEIRVGQTAQETSHRHRRLRARGERPCHRSTEKHDEIAPLYLTELHPLPPTMERQNSGLANIKSGLLRCGILTWLMTGLGQEFA